MINRRRLTIFLYVVLFLAVLWGLLFLLSYKEKPSHITYGMSFNASYAEELGLNPHEVLTALLDELHIRHFRIAAHWNRMEPRKDTYDFTRMDDEVKLLEERGATAIFAVGRRLPRWPECHVPEWAKEESWEEQKKEILQYITDVVTRYRDSRVITHWQVENEPYLTVFASEHCGATLDEAFLEEEIALVHSLDPGRPVLITDSGNLGTWRGAYTHGDAFGTSVYVYLWNPELGPFRTILPSWFYRTKENILRLFYGKRETLLIELSLEPWLVEPIASVPLEVQYARMSPPKMDEILEYARRTRYATQYLWGGEWWYWLKKNGDPTFWEKGKEIFNTGE